MHCKKTCLFFALFVTICLVLFFKPQPKPHSISIGIIGDDFYCGERELSWRIKRAAENLGWTIFLDESRGHVLKKIKGLDWVISTVPHHRERNKHCPNYAALLHPLALTQDLLYEQATKHRPFFKRYDGYLITSDPGKKFEDFLESNNKKFFSTPFYPTLQYVEYVKVPLNNIMAMIAVWGDRLDDEKFKCLYSLLSRGGFTKFYGINPHQDIIAKENYLGAVAFDGISVIHALQRHGISLVFHSDVHNREEIPSSRIFEAAAASTVIICDHNAFVKKHFGDAVFYVDTTLAAEEIYRQIENCMDIIKKDPEKALDMAKKAHQLFVDRFLMETQLKNVMAMHQKILKQW